MKALTVDNNSDLVFVDGLIQFSTDINAVLMVCQQAMKTNLGELKYDITKGIEWRDNVFTGNPNFQRFEAQSRNTLLAVDNVTRVKSFTFTITDDTLSYDAVIVTTFREGSISGTV